MEHLVGVAVQQASDGYIDEIRRYAEQLLRKTASRDPGGLADVMRAHVRDEQQKSRSRRADAGHHLVLPQPSIKVAIAQ